MRTRICLGSLALIACIVVGSHLANAATSPTSVDPKLLQQTIDRGVAYLLKNQNPHGSFNTAQQSPAYTAIAIAALLRSGQDPDAPAIAQALKYLEGFVQSDGGIYKPGSTIQNYETSIAIMGFAEANKKDGRYKKLIKSAEDYVKSIQWGADGKTDESSINYGGAGYGRSKTRPDLSNTSFLLDALQAAGDEAGDEAVQRALVFVSRCQNLESQYNTTPFAAKVKDGGFYYTISDGGASMAGKTDDDGLRSYGSMTYAGLKSMIFAGLAPEDIRVKAAVDWIKKHYSLDSNPGMGQAGLYYGYHTFAKALSALGQDSFVDDKGVGHPWKVELLAELANRQHDDGSWVNSTAQFQESNPNLVTSYSLLALSYCTPTAKK
jgi:squalene-hopene/tetraprenyl-beta-curcumene cyclase